MPRFLPVGKDAKGAAAFLLAALPALGALLTALAVTGDLVGRMARNHPWATAGAFGCSALAVVLGAVVAFGLREGSPEERRVLFVGIGVLGGALALGVYAAVAASGRATTSSWRWSSSCASRTRMGGSSGSPASRCTAPRSALTAAAPSRRPSSSRSRPA